MVRQSDLQANFQPKLLPNIVYKQNVFQSLSQLTLTALFTKESLAIRLVKNADLHLNKRTKESRVCGLFGLLSYSGKQFK